MADLSVDLTYGVADKSRPWGYFGGAIRTEAERQAEPLRKEDYGGASKTMKTTIWNARKHLPDSRLDERSFELARFVPENFSNADFYRLGENGGALKEKLYEQVEAFLKQHFKADVVVE